MEKIIQKEGRQQATHLCHSPRDFEKEDKKAKDIAKITAMQEERRREKQNQSRLSPVMRSISPSMGSGGSPGSNMRFYPDQVLANSVDGNNIYNPVASFISASKKSKDSFTPIPQQHVEGNSQHRHSALSLPVEIGPVTVVSQESQN